MKVRIDGLMVLVLSVLGGLVWLAFKREDIKDALNKINPASQENIIYQEALELGILSGEAGGWEDKLIGAFELVNPWASDTSKNYARQVWGLDQ